MNEDFEHVFGILVELETPSVESQSNAIIATYGYITTVVISAKSSEAKYENLKGLRSSYSSVVMTDETLLHLEETDVFIPFLFTLYNLNYGLQVIMGRISIDVTMRLSDETGLVELLLDNHIWLPTPYANCSKVAEEWYELVSHAVGLVRPHTGMSIEQQKTAIDLHCGDIRIEDVSGKTSEQTIETIKELGTAGFKTLIITSVAVFSDHLATLLDMFGLVYQLGLAVGVIHKSRLVDVTMRNDEETGLVGVSIDGVDWLSDVIVP